MGKQMLPLMSSASFSQSSKSLAVALASSMRPGFVLAHLACSADVAVEAILGVVAAAVDVAFVALALLERRLDLLHERGALLPLSVTDATRLGSSILDLSMLGLTSAASAAVLSASSRVWPGPHRRPSSWPRRHRQAAWLSASWRARSSSARFLAAAASAIRLASARRTFPHLSARMPSAAASACCALLSDPFPAAAMSACCLA